MRITLSRVVAVVLLSSSLVAVASDFEAELAAIQQEWAVIKYRGPVKEQEDAYAQLTRRTARFAQLYPDRAEPLIWDAIVLASYAGAKGGLGALSAVKQARRELEQALAIDAQALSGSAYTTLGSLHAKVPGWPLAFGSRKKAEEYLQKALAMNPDGIDPNFFYGELLLEQGRTTKAIAALEKALRAPGRPGRRLADDGRRQEIRALLARAQSAPPARSDGY